MIKSVTSDKLLVPSLVTKLEQAAELSNRLKELNVFITSTFTEALNQAKALKAFEGSLSGLTVAVKDCYSTKNVRTTCGSKMLSNYVPPYTATVVDRLVRNGALMVGKTNMDEFCMGASSTESIFGPVKNPWTLKLWRNKDNLQRLLCKDWYLAGGSSGGSAAAVAAGLADIALGSDTGGSTRNPASFCGVVGYKPTYGLLSRHGLIPLTNSLDVPGIMARNVDNIALALDALAGVDTKDPTSIERSNASYLLPEDPCLKGLVVGLPEEYFTPNLSKSVVDWWQNIAALLEKRAGCKLVTVSLPHTRYSIICYHVLGECEVASNMARFDGLEFGYRADESTSLNKLYALSRHDAFNDIVRRRILAGNYFLLRKNYEHFYLKSLKVRRLIANDFYEVFRGDQKVDILLTPVTLSEAPLYSEWRSDDEGYDRERSDDFFTQPVNMAGIPAISLPVGLSNSGLPVGLQIIGDFKHDKKILSVAKWIEKIVDFGCLKQCDIDILINSDIHN